MWKLGSWSSRVKWRGIARETASATLLNMMQFCAKELQKMHKFATTKNLKWISKSDVKVLHHATEVSLSSELVKQIRGAFPEIQKQTKLQSWWSERLFVTEVNAFCEEVMLQTEVNAFCEEVKQNTSSNHVTGPWGSKKNQTVYEQIAGFKHF